MKYQSEGVLRSCLIRGCVSAARGVGRSDRQVALLEMPTRFLYVCGHAQLADQLSGLFSGEVKLEEEASVPSHEEGRVYMPGIFEQGLLSPPCSQSDR